MKHHPFFALADGGGSAALFAVASASLADGPDDIGVIARCDVPMCVADATMPDMPITFANDAFLALTGYALNEIVGRNCRLLQGPQTSPEDAARFRGGFADGRPFQVAIVNHRKSGEAFRNEVFISPVRDASGAIVRYIGMQIAGTPPGSGETATVAALRHQFRNQIQNMTSLVSLLGQRLPHGEGRDAFEDLRARFEAVTIGQSDELTGEGPVAADRVLARLIDRIVQLYDPRRTHDVQVAIAPLQTSARRAGVLAQIATELAIDLFRNGLRHGPARAEISACVEDDGAFRLRMTAADVVPAPALGSTDLGMAIVQNLARSLGGSFERSVEGGLSSVAVLPPETDRH